MRAFSGRCAVRRIDWLDAASYADLAGKLEVVIGSDICYVTSAAAPLAQ